MKVINVTDVEHSCTFNPLARLESHTDIGQLADVLIHHAFPDSRGDQFWNTSARSFLAVLIQCLKNEPPQYCNLYNLRYLVNAFGRDGSALNTFVVRNADKATYHEWKAFISQDSKVMQNIISTARAALEKVTDTSIARLTSTDTLGFEDLRRRRTSRCNKG